jgi:heterodisulfide reductase subunit A-like polyferredoxin
MDDNRAVINEANCRGCGRCASACPEEAISVSVERADYLTATLERVDKINYA